MKCRTCNVEIGSESESPLCGWCECDQRNAARRGEAPHNYTAATTALTLQSREGFIYALKSPNVGELIATCHCENRLEMARLFAVAPDLLLIAKSILDEFEDGLDRYEWRLAAARAAVAKAGGTQ